jgi:hypothetical protein
MGFVASARGQIQAADSVIPDSAQTPFAHTHLKALADALEARVALRVASIGAVSTLNPLQDGMVVVTTSSPQEMYLRAAGAWVKVHPRIYSGTTTPSAGLGANGDVYIQYT